MIKCFKLLNLAAVFTIAVLIFTVSASSPDGMAYASAKIKNETKEEKMESDKKIFLETGLAIRKAVIVPAKIDEVWRAWTTTAGVRTFFAPEARIQLAVGGDYELYFDPKQPDGSKGSEDCKILSFSPGEMLSFTWNAPPSLPTIRKVHTWVVLNFYPQEGDKTRVTLIHLGWRVGEDWQSALKYFDKAWEVVLGRLQYRFQKESVNWKDPFTPGKK